MTTLLDFTEPPVYRIPGTGRNAKTIHRVTIQPPSCDCDGFKYKGDCIHINKAKWLLAAKENQYLRTRYERTLESLFHSFEAFYEWCWQDRGNPEAVYLSKLFLALLYCQPERQGTTDLIHYAVGEQFVGDPRKIGAVVRRLTDAGLIDRTGRVIPSDRPQCHNAPKQEYTLTEKGAGLVEAGDAE